MDVCVCSCYRTSHYNYCTSPVLPLAHRRTSSRPRCRVNVVSATIMMSVFFCLSVFAISLSCCAVLVNPEYQALAEPSGPQSRVSAASERGGYDEEEVRYQRDLDNFETNNNLLGRKTLLDDDFQETERLLPPRATHHQQHAKHEHQEKPDVEYHDSEDTSQYAEKEYSDWEKDRVNLNVHGVERNIEVMEKISTNGTKKLPEALIIGVKKGGTRALLEFIRIHPDVRAPGPEPHFFDRHFEKGLDWYRQQMPATLDSQMTMEKTPSYFVTKNVPGRIYNMSKNMKLILVVRDPVTRALSDYAQTASKRDDVKPFEQMAFLDNSTGLVDTSWGAIRIGVYAKHLERWLKYFPLEQIHIVNGEKLITDPAAEMAKVQKFLGLKPVITEKHFYFNTTKGFPCLKKPEGSGKPHCLGKTKGRPHPKVDPQVLQRLRDFYKPFNQKFYQMTGTDFGWT